jgi:hypothetical protein
MESCGSAQISIANLRLSPTRRQSEWHEGGRDQSLIEGARVAVSTWTSWKVLTATSPARIAQVLVGSAFWVSLIWWGIKFRRTAEPPVTKVWP